MTLILFILLVTIASWAVQKAYRVGYENGKEDERKKNNLRYFSQE
jgi:hypothetical protein